MYLDLYELRNRVFKTEIASENNERHYWFSNAHWPSATQFTTISLLGELSSVAEPATLFGPYIPMEKKAFTFTSPSSETAQLSAVLPAQNILSPRHLDGVIGGRKESEQNVISSVAVLYVVEFWAQKLTGLT